VAGDYHGHGIMVTKRRPPVLEAQTVRESPATYRASGASRAIPAGEFKARCLALMDHVQRSGIEYVITKRGVPVARLLPAVFERRPLLGSLTGTVLTADDLASPLDEPWEALEGWDGED
jgi:prevent-host-death family protein